MSIAKTKFKRFGALTSGRVDDEGRVDPLALGQFIADVERSATGSRLVCKDSIDSSIEYTFEDGSVLVLNNPRQFCYGAFCSFVAE